MAMMKPFWMLLSMASSSRRRTPSPRLQPCLISNPLAWPASLEHGTDLTMTWTTSGERPSVSPVDQRGQEVRYGWLLTGSNVVPVAGLCALLYGPQLCLFPGLYVGPDGGRGPQMSDPSCPVRLLSSASSQQLGAVPRGTSLEPDSRHATPGHAGGDDARGHPPGSWGLLAGQRHHMSRQDLQADGGGPDVERPQRQRRSGRLSGWPPLEPGGADQSMGNTVVVLAPGDAAGPGAPGRSAMDRWRHRRDHELLGCRPRGHPGGHAVLGGGVGAGGGRCLLQQGAVSQRAAGTRHPRDQPPA